MSAYPSQEYRPLKKPKFGAPDLYPQDPKQKEDELTATSVKHGFNNNPTIHDEHGSARSQNISQEKFGIEFISVLNKKQEINTFQDTTKKKQQPTKDNFWPAAKNQNAMRAWFKDLAGNKPLSSLGKKVPTFNKKEEIFSTLCEYSVPMIKAAWFIKMTTAYNVAMQENKTKQRRQIIDQSIEWCQALTKYLKDQILKIQEPLSGPGATSGFLTVSQPDPNQALKQWHYVTKLAHHMYDEGLLDRHEFLNWLIEMLEKMKQSEDTVLKLLLHQVLLYLEEITMSTLLSRKLAHFSCKKLTQMINDTDCMPPRTESPMLTNGGTGMTSSQLMPQNPLLSAFAQYNNCPQHRGIVLSLCATLQVITFLCPTSLVWNNLGEGRSGNYLCGSPLDILLCSPSSLPMPEGPQNQQIRTHIRSMEHQIGQRGRAAEVRWSSDKCQQSSRGFTISRILEVLDTLDRHNFDRVDTNNNLETLYNKIFMGNQNKEASEPFVSDESIIHLLIDWAVSTRRCGNYRAVVVAKLLEKRQNEMRNEDLDMLECEDGMGDDVMVTSESPFFQNMLMSYLDDKAPTLDENPTDENRQGFANLIQLFSELIRHDVFSHDAYMCFLISRGDLLTSPAVMSVAADSIDLSSVKSMNESIKHEHQDDFKVEMDLQIGLESDLNALFGSVKDEQKPSPEQPASVKSIKSEKEQNAPSTSGAHESTNTPKGPSRHMLYAQHFPISQEDSVHECNQRMVVLYGVGKARDEAQQVVKKIEKSALKMFHKRKCIDTTTADSTMSRPKQNNEAKFESVFSKFQKLSYHDQHNVTTQCKNCVLDHIGNFLSGSSTYIPYVENVSYLFDMMEYSLNIYGLLDFSVQLLKELSIVEEMLSEQNSSLCGSYTTSLCLCIVGIFRKYHSYLLVSQDLTIMAFEGLISVVQKVCNPSDCSSAERCILAYLYDAYTSCSYLREKFQDIFSNAYRKMKMTLYAIITPSASNKLWDPSFMMDCLNNINIKAPLDNNLIKQLNENPANRYSFVCNAMLWICHCNAQQTDKLNEMSILCAELTARCNALSSEWLGVLQALCCSSNHSCGFIDILTQIDVSDMSIHDSLAVFTAILIARHCFSLQDLVVHVVLPSLLMARPSATGDQDAESGARLTCHILLRLFKNSDMNLTSPGPGVGTKNTCNIKGSCDKHLLDAAHDSISVGPVLAVLKAMLVLSDMCSDDMKSKSGSSSRKEDKEGDIFSMLLNSVEADDDMNMIMGSKHKQGLESAGLSDFAKHALREMCRQDWVQEKFLKDPESVLNIDLLLDTMLSNKQAQQLLQMICYPNGVPNQVDGSEPDIKQVIQRILQTLDLWSFRVTLLELQLMFKQATTQSETNVLLDNIAKATIELFHRQTSDGGNGRGPNEREIIQPKPELDKDAVWMVGPLIAKLPSQVQGRVLKLSGSVLECGSSILSKGREKERSQRSKSLLGHQPFLSLVLSCMKGQEEQREALLSSLLSQLDKFMNNCKEALDKTPDEFKVRANIHEALSLRLSLVGGMFDTIQRNINNTTEWAILLVQLVTNGIVDIQSNGELFTVILDMMCVLIHGSLIPEGAEKGEENTKAYMGLIKKIRKELADKQSDSIDKIRQLLPIPKKMFEVISCEAYGTQMDSKGNKYDGFGKKQGFQVAKKEKISPWEVIEGVKNPPPLSWPYFGAVKLEKKPLKYEEQHRLLLHHTHSLRQSLSYYLDKPVLPPEDLEPPQEKQEDKPKESNDAQIQEGAKRKKSSKKVKRTNSGSGTYIPPPPSRYQQWGYPPSLPPQPSNTYYSSNPLSAGPSQGPRFDSSPYVPNPKLALQNMIRTRHPNSIPNWNSGQNSAHALAMLQKNNMHKMVRQQLRQSFQNQHRLPDQGMFMGGSMQPGGMHSMNQPPVGMSQNYGGPSYNISQPSSMEGMPPSGGGMMNQGYNQSYPSGQNPGMMQPMNSSAGPGYMSQQPPQQHFNPASGRIMHSGGGMQTGNTMTGMSGGASYSQMGGPSGAPPQGSYMQNMAPNQQRMIQQQNIMAMRRQQSMGQQQQPMSQQQQQHAAMIAQLQQQMSQQPNPNQFNNYPNQPPQY